MVTREIGRAIVRGHPSGAAVELTPDDRRETEAA
ncbi:MAG: hypothetical protein AVDCRST_MAG40-1168 [uncultured Gemmatimonadaceae bacterium]|uniref:Uncharacterized protein n=1 Tax=uncultured Gemmatimonadaceae bacterium TaxID=246130 RepID=A0A6J4KYG6_9BACT|nr:MAG: hypothetical protein AVDCRST_MAG40-1168 [uncultured Gemmatimonadaceae bacterium]